jgi:predicted dehydrogenase
MRAALIGLGMVAKTYGDAFRNTDKVQLVSVHARSDASRAKFLDTWPDLGAKAAASIEEIAASDVDFVILTTPPNARAEIVEVLTKAGKPILMEKPVERDLPRATALVEHCEAAGLPLGIVLQHRFRPIVAEARKALADLGPLQMVECNVGWWRPQSYYDEPGRGTYERDGGGVMISQAIHIMDLMLSLTGQAQEVTAMLATTGLHRMESEDFASAGLRFESGAVGSLYATTAAYPGRGESITLHCRDGSIRLERGALQIDRQDGTSEQIGKTAASGSGADPMAFSSDAHRFVIEDFAEALRDGRPPRVTGREALGVHRLIAALEASGRADAKVNLKDI